MKKSIIILLISINTIQAAELPIAIADLAKILNYPAEKITATDMTEEARRKRDGGGIISGFVYAANDDVFAPISIAVATEGTLLTDKQRQRISERQNELKATNPTIVHSLREISVASIATGYAGVGAVGPGGSGLIAIVSIPSKQIDVRITMNVRNLTPGEDAPKITEATKNYHELIINGGDRLTDKLVECMTATVMTLVASETVTPGTEMPVRPPSLPSITNTAQTVPKVEPVTPEPSVTNQPVQKSPQTFVEPQSAAPATPAKQVSSMKNIFIVLAALLVLAGWWILIRAKK